jgi:ferredoxin, 2Fe-2S
MTTVTVQPSGQTVEAAAGTTLFQALKTAGFNILSKCEGKGQCGACHVFVHEGRKTLSRIQSTENEKLDTMVGISSKSRLACQAVLGEEPVTVELLSFV